MKKNQSGFGAAEIILVIVVIGLLGVVGWFVYDRQKNKTGSQQPASQVTEQNEEAKQSTTYAFKELGISMEILDGWEVKANHSKEEGGNLYNWSVEKAGADGKINLSSRGFTGGFLGCGVEGDSLTAAVVREVSSTQNPNLVFMSWSYEYDNEVNDRTVIALASENFFRATNDEAAEAIPNRDISSGNYFFCLSDPRPGFSLGLNDEEVAGASRIDSISALSSSSSEDDHVALPANAQSYSDIRDMLITVR